MCRPTATRGDDLPVVGVERLARIAGEESPTDKFGMADYLADVTTLGIAHFWGL